MVANDNDYMKSMAFHMHVLTEDEKLKMACEQKERDSWDKSFAYASGEKSGKILGKAEAEQELKPIIEKQAAELSEQAAEIATLKKTVNSKLARFSEPVQKYRFVFL